MTNQPTLLLAARLAGQHQDWLGLDAAVRVWLAGRRAEGAWWAGSGSLSMADFEALDAGMLLLAGEAASVAAAVAARRVVDDELPDGRERRRPFVEVAESELDNYGLRDLAWQRVLRADWRAVPPARPRWGQLLGVGRRGDRVARQILVAFAARDRESIEAAIKAAAALEGSARFSLFGLAREARRLGIDPGAAGPA
jgi:hypothetical protein